VAAAIPLTLIAGFLGSGKTTLLNRLLASPAVGTAAVIVNEFGEIGVDHHLVRNASGAVIRLEDGCICCSLQGGLVDALTNLLVERSAGTVPPFGRVFVETTGIAAPGSIIDMVVSAPALAARFRIDRVVTTVEVRNGLATLEEFTEAEDQAAAADCLVLTKLDLVDAGAQGAVAQLTARLAVINPSATVIEGHDAAVASLACIDDDRAPRGAELQARRALQHAADHHAGRPAGNGHDDHDHHDIHTASLIEEMPVSLDQLHAFLDAVAREAGRKLLRVKGLVNIAERPGRPAVIHAARGLAHAIEWLDDWPSDDRRSRIVLISRGIPQEQFADMWTLVKRFMRGPAPSVRSRLAAE
jgi:G3E family GTPase